MSVLVPPTQDSVLRQRAVADSVRSLICSDVVHGDADPSINVLVMENVMPMAMKENTKQV